VIRARIFRAGPGCWSFDIYDEHEELPIFVGNAGTWELARKGAVDELRIFAGHDLPALPASPRPAGWRRWLGHS
jgi:hypothetical protein